jgi:hypothetical protein
MATVYPVQLPIARGIYRDSSLDSLYSTVIVAKDFDSLVLGDAKNRQGSISTISSEESYDTDYSIDLDVFYPFVFQEDFGASTAVTLPKEIPKNTNSYHKRVIVNPFPPSLTKTWDGVCRASIDISRESFIKEPIRTTTSSIKKKKYSIRNFVKKLLSSS